MSPSGVNTRIRAWLCVLIYFANFCWHIYPAATNRKYNFKKKIRKISEKKLKIYMEIFYTKRSNHKITNHESQIFVIINLWFCDLNITKSQITNHKITNHESQILWSKSQNKKWADTRKKVRDPCKNKITKSQISQNHNHKFCDCDLWFCDCDFVICDMWFCDLAKSISQNHISQITKSRRQSFGTWGEILKIIL